MKLLVRLLMIAIIAVSCESKKTDLRVSNIKGKVWKIQETSYEAEEKFGKYQIGDKADYGHALYIFNEKGNLTESQTLDSKGKTKEILKNTFSKDDLCIEIATYSDDKLQRKQIGNFKGKNLIEVKVYDENGKEENTYKYYYAGNEISGFKVFNNSGNIINTYVNEFSNGQLIAQTTKDSINQVIRTSKYKSNSNNDIIESKAYYPKDSTEYKYTFDYEYDRKGNWIKQYQFDKEGKIENIVLRNIIYYGDSKSIRSEKDFVGIWFVEDDTDWYEFRNDKKYDYGYKDEISESGNWEIDKKQRLLTFRASDPAASKKYKYEFEGSQLILYTIQGEEKIRLKKR